MRVKNEREAEILALRTAQSEVITACLVLEAAGEGGEGMMAVMNVIANRAKNNPENFYREATRPRQFSALNSANGSYDRHIQRAKQSRMWDIAEVIVQEAYAGTLPDITGGATHYYATWMDNAPYWAASMDETVTLKQHRFMR